MEEPSLLSEYDTPLGKLRHVTQVQSYLIDAKSDYINHIRTKINNISIWSSQRGANIIIFPEYSIPPIILPELRKIAIDNKVLIVAGTHRIESGEEVREIYKSLDLLPQSVQAGAACAPILFPDGHVEVVNKSKRSKWEANLKTIDEDPKLINVELAGVKIRLSVVPCIDSLHPDIFGKLFDDDLGSPNLILCPSLSPSISPFHHVGSVAVWKEVLFAYVNSAVFGGTFFGIPDNWKPYLKGPVCNLENIPKGIEAILEIDINPQALFLKKGSLESSIPCSNPISFPIVYKKESNWLDEFEDKINKIVDFVEDNKIANSIEMIDSYLTDKAYELPDLVTQNIKYLRHCLLPLYDGNLEI
jgi:hypothetical protein